TVLDAHVPVAQLGPPRSQRLDLGAGQLDACLEGLEDRELVAGATIAGQHAVARGSAGRHRLPRRKAAAVIAREPGGSTRSMRNRPSRDATTTDSPSRPSTTPGSDPAAASTGLPASRRTSTPARVATDPGHGCSARTRRSTSTAVSAAQSN